MNALRLFCGENTKIMGRLSNVCTRLLSTDTDSTTSRRPRTEKCLNKVTLLGRVGKEGEVRGTTDHPCLIFPLATSFTYRKATTGEFLKKTDWHRICVFQPGLRNIASTISKGDRILVEGSLSHQRFMDEDRPINITSIIAENIVFLSQRNTPAEDYAEEDLD